MAQENCSGFNVSKWYFSKYQMCRKGRFSQRRSYITIYHTAMALLASTHFILTRYNSSYGYRLITSSHGLLRLINFSLDHVIPHMLFMCCMTLISPIIPALFLVLLASYYSQNYVGILASPLARGLKLPSHFKSPP